MLTLNSPQIVQETVLRWKKKQPIAFVPTMGCLHEGHLELVKRAKACEGKTVVSIFVNPLQFGPNEDFEKYPRTLEQDTEKLEALDVDLLFTPSGRDLYPDGFRTEIRVKDLTTPLCGISRPGHFDGVTTVVMKLFQITQPDFAVFGEKDFQQLRIIQQMTSDMNLPISIINHPTVREEDGLALSSRNRFLSEEQRSWARKIPESIRKLRRIALDQPQATVGALLETAKNELESVPLVIDYIAIASAVNLVPAGPSVPLSELSAPRFFVAVKAGSTRLIDNASLSGDTR